MLELLHRSSVPAPVVIATDPTGVCCDVPAMLLTRLAGNPPGPGDRSGDAFCRELAETLVEIHDLDPPAVARLEPYHLYYDRAHATPSPWMPDTSVWRQAALAVRRPPPPGASRFIHRDYHPENTLWLGGHLTGVVDWTQASSGPPGLDLGHMRWNLVADHGQRVADRFLDCYRSITGRLCDDQPYWDLVSLLDLLLDGDDPGDIEADDLQRFADYAGDALSRLG